MKTIKTFIFLILPLLAFSQPKNCGGSADLTVVNNEPGCAISCVWTGPNGYSSTLCNPPDITPLEPIHTGTYTVSVTDCNLCEEVFMLDVGVSTPTIEVFVNDVACFMFAVVTGCEGGQIDWTGPNGFTATNTSTIGVPTALSDCGTYTATLTCPGGCADPTDTGTLTTGTCCCISCTANIVESVTPDCNTNVTFSQSPACANAQSYAWQVTLGGVPVSNGTSPTHTYNFVATGVYEVILTLTDECGTVTMSTNNYNITCFDCGCVATLAADDTNCLLDITTSGTGCGNYTIGILKYTANGCGGPNCTMVSGLAAVDQSYDPSGTSCPPVGDTDVGYRIILSANAGTGCTTVISPCVNLNCVDCTLCSATATVVGDQTLSCDDLDITIVPSGCTAAYTYSYTSTGTLTEAGAGAGLIFTIPSTNEAYGAAGTYEITMTDANGCTDVISVPYTRCDPAAPLTFVNLAVDANCNGTSLNVSMNGPIACLFDVVINVVESGQSFTVQTNVGAGTCVTTAVPLSFNAIPYPVGLFVSGTNNSFITFESGGQVLLTSNTILSNTTCP